MSKFLDRLDHPVVFVFFVTMAVLGASSLVTWGAKSWGLPGLASLSQHP